MVVIKPGLALIFFSLAAVTGLVTSEKAGLAIHLLSRGGVSAALHPHVNNDVTLNSGKAGLATGSQVSVAVEPLQTQPLCFVACGAYSKIGFWTKF